MQTETKAQTEAEALADAILNAAGTGLTNYMPSSRERIIAAAQAGIDASRAELLTALETFVKQWNACGPNSDFGRHFKNVRDAAVSAIAQAQG